MFSPPITRNESGTMKQDKIAPSLLSANLRIRGHIITEGAVHIDGVVEGNIRAHSVTTGEHSQVNGEIAGDDVTIKGRTKGIIRAHSIHLCKGCQVRSDLYSQTLAIEHGSGFHGAVHQEKNPLAEASIALKKDEKKS